MQYFIIFMSLASLLINPAFAKDEPEEPAEVDFSKAYVISDTKSPDQIRIGGVETHTDEESLIHALALKFDPASVRFRLLKATPQESDTELLEQFLKKTSWVGDYKTSNNIYRTTLAIKTVQNGFIAGEMRHETRDPETPDILMAQVAGYIVTQYLIEDKWTDADKVNLEKLPSDVVIPPDNIDHIRHLMRLRRMQALEFQHHSGQWGTLHEYRMVLVEDDLTGSVGVPPDRYGTKDALKNVGEIALKREIPEEEADTLE
jgi:hypothetical protein